jgi:hypothetical protein
MEMLQKKWVHRAHAETTPGNPRSWLPCFSHPQTQNDFSVIFVALLGWAETTQKQVMVPKFQ